MSMGDMDCGDNSCLFAWKKGGVRTNGGCRCMQDAPAELRRNVQLWAQRAKQEIKAARAELTAERYAAKPVIPDPLRGVMSTGDQNEPLTTEDYARLAQVSPETFDDGFGDALTDMSADQACALFDLARKGMEADDAIARARAEGFEAGRVAERRDVVAFSDSDSVWGVIGKVEHGHQNTHAATKELAGMLEQGLHVGAAEKP